MSKRNEAKKRKKKQNLSSFFGIDTTLNKDGEDDLVQSTIEKKEKEESVSESTITIQGRKESISDIEGVDHRRETVHTKVKEKIVDNSHKSEKNELNRQGIDSSKINESMFFLGTRYDPQSNKAKLLFYDGKTQSCYSTIDNSGHKPYLITSEPEIIQSHPNLSTFCDGTEQIKLVDLLNDSENEYTKLFTHTPSDVPKIRGLLPSWEDRIQYHHCWIYDNDLLPGMLYSLEKADNEKFWFKELQESGKSSFLSQFSKDRITELEKEEKYRVQLDHYLPLFLTPIPKIKAAAFDIETGTYEDRIPRPELAEDQVTCICIVGNDGYNTALVLKRSDQVMDEKPVDFPDVEIKTFITEKELLEAFFHEIDAYPFVITFNGNKFDLQYLITRSRKLKVETNIEYNRRRGLGTFANGMHIDLYTWFDNPAIKIYAFGARYKISSLDEISKAILGEGKITISKSFGELAFHELIYYCWKDSKLTLDLFSWEEYLNFHLMVLLQRISHLPLEDLINSRVSNWIKNLFYYFHRKYSFLIPNKNDIRVAKGHFTSSQAVTKDKKYQGAIVIEPERGLHFDVTVLDFASLYPSIMSSYNLSYETVNCTHADCRENIIPGTSYWSCTKKHGIFATLVGFLKEVRVKWFKPGAKADIPEKRYFSAVEKSLKVLINASYGVMGAEMFPLYCLPVADATTAIGRHAIKKTVEKCEELGLPVLYGDTDSVFVKSPSIDQIEELKKFSERELKISLEIDKEYRFCALSERKKNYIGILKSGAVDIKGLTGKKSNTPLFLQEAFKETMVLLQGIESQEDYPKTIEDIKQVIRECYRKLENKEYSLKELVFSVQLTRPLNTYTVASQHVKAARQLSDQQDIKPGRIIRFVKTRDQDGVKPVEMAKLSDISIKTYKSHVDSVFSQILDAFDIDLDEVKGERKINLSEFFGKQQ